LEELFKKGGAGAGLLGMIGLGNKFGGLDSAHSMPLMFEADSRGSQAGVLW
jgi:hypothetical protein